MKKLKFDVAGKSDVGIIKHTNEDSFVYKVVDTGEHYAGVFAVADGVGGLDKGEVASSIAISNINKWWENDFKKDYQDLECLKKNLLNTFWLTNIGLIEYAKSRTIKIATTLSLLLFYQNNFIIMHVGDSRIYKIHGILKGKIEQLTLDHSCYINREVNGQIMRKSVLTECLGNKQDFNHYYKMDSIKNNETYLVCSDGIYKTQTDSQILKIIKDYKNNLDQLCQKLIDTAKENGETDNISVIAIKVKY